MSTYYDISRPSEQSPADHDTPVHHGVAIVGAGFTGLALAIELKRARLHDFVILERGDDVGGVWRDNDYPGIAVDTPSKIYNLSRALNPEWSHLFAEGHEVADYARTVARRFELLPHVRFRHEVLDAIWDETDGVWRIDTNAGRFTCNVLVSAAGLVADPKIPQIPGLDEFPGPVFHSSQWDHELDLRGKRVAVVGTGASAIQFVPRIQPEVAALHVLQRTPTWISPKPPIAYDERAKRRLRRLPGLMRAERILMYWLLEYNSLGRRSKRIRDKRVAQARAHLHQQVQDPELRRALTPDFEFLCKRPLISSDYFPALTRPNVRLHTGGLVEVRGNTVVAGDGTQAEVDVVILNTGFEVGRTTPIARRLRGREAVALHDHWNGHGRAYLGMCVPGFPNLFMMQGPNATSGVSSALIFGEAQARYITDAVKTMRRQDVRSIEVRPAREEAWHRKIRRMSAKTVYEVGGCLSYYLDDDGRNVVMWPGFTLEYQLRTRRFDPRAYIVRRHPGARRSGPAAVRDRVRA